MSEPRRAMCGVSNVGWVFPKARKKRPSRAWAKYRRGAVMTAPLAEPNMLARIVTATNVEPMAPIVRLAAASATRSAPAISGIVRVFKKPTLARIYSVVTTETPRIIAVNYDAGS
jgi:hypothetical protein